MVQKSKGGKKCRSVVAGKKKKNAMKNKRKSNYKKKKIIKKTCVVCMEEVEDKKDHTITCGKVDHTLCGECKLKCVDCPMCRSHKVQQPISQDVKLRILEKNQISEKKMVRISVKGLVKIRRIPGDDGIYIEIDKDSNGYGIYINEKYRDLYIYRDYEGDWVLNNTLSPESDYNLGIGFIMDNTNLFGKNKWCIGRSDTIGFITIKKVR